MKSNAKPRDSGTKEKLTDDRGSSFDKRLEEERKKVRQSISENL